MFSRLIATLSGKPQPTSEGPSGASGEAPLYAIGDIHGRADLLEPLLENVRKDAAGRSRTHFVALGDYVDRGHDSRRVVDLLLELAAEPEIEAHFLRGNHDQILLDFLADPGLGPYWRRVGGGETLCSYGVDPPATRKQMDQWVAARDAFAAQLPEQHLRFFQELNLSFIWGGYFFAHAGAQPGTPLEAQSERDLMWIRKPFLEDEAAFDRIVVHGHTPAEEVHADHRRIGLDTGAYMTGVLTACRFEAGERRLIQAVERHDADPEIRHRPF
jgi:serine/threonine protein phosphatase 1